VKGRGAIEQRPIEAEENASHGPRPVKGRSGASASIAARSSAAGRQPAAPTLARTCAGVVAPAITDATGACAASQEIARSRIVCPRAAANDDSFSTIARFSSLRKRCGLRRPSPDSARRVPAGAGVPGGTFP